MRFSYIYKERERLINLERNETKIMSCFIYIVERQKNISLLHNRVCSKSCKCVACVYIIHSYIFKTLCTKIFYFEVIQDPSLYLF